MCDCNKNYSPVANAFKAATDVLKGFADSKYNPYCTKEEANRRLDICKGCDKITSFMGKPQCSICYCFVEPKTKLIDQSCPHPDGPKW